MVENVLQDKRISTMENYIAIMDGWSFVKDIMHIALVYVMYAKMSFKVKREVHCVSRSAQKYIIRFSDGFTEIQTHCSEITYAYLVFVG